MQLEVDPSAINTVAVSLEDGSTIYAVAGASEEKKLVSMQKRIEEEKTIASLMQVRDEIAAAQFSGVPTVWLDHPHAEQGTQLLRGARKGWW